jgi:hypothetical protein
MHMNKKQKILTILALVAFGAIIALHCFGFTYENPNQNYPKFAGYQNGMVTIAPLPGAGFYFQHSPLIHDVRMPLFVLAVFYAGLFSLLGDKKRDSQ